MMDPVLIATLLAQGMRLWADYADRAAKGTLTDADLTAMAGHTGTDINALKSEIAAMP